MQRPFIIKCINVIRERGLIGFIKKIEPRHFDALKIIFYPYANLRISKEIRKPFTAEKAVNFVFNKFGGYLKPYQFKSEILNLAKIAEQKKPKVVLEIGTYTGGTFFILSRLASEDAHLISIDLPGEEGGSNNWAYPKWKEAFYKKFASSSQKINLIRANSQDKQTLEGLKKILAGSQVDFLFIDGDHSYESVKKDYNLYAPLVKKGGIISFHDIIKFPEYTGVNVKKLWDEVKEGKKFKEFVENPNQTWGGIGVIFV